MVADHRFKLTGHCINRQYIHTIHAFVFTWIKTVSLVGKRFASKEGSLGSSYWCRPKKQSFHSETQLFHGLTGGIVRMDVMKAVSDHTATYGGMVVTETGHATKLIVTIQVKEPRLAPRNTQRKTYCKNHYDQDSLIKHVNQCSKVRQPSINSPYLLV